MTGKLYGKYWDYGFRSGLYGLLAPEVYRQSLARTAHHLALSPGQVMLDAGCGSGMLLPYLRQPLLQGGRYVGVDILRPGLAAARRQARHLGLAAKTRWLRADLAKPLPLAPASFAAAAAHFSVYTLPRREDRLRAWCSLRAALCPGGRLVAVTPATGYDGRSILNASLTLLAQHGKGTFYWVSRWLLYPLTLRLGLRHVRSQLNAGNWHACHLEEFKEELRDSGFIPVQEESVYGGSGWLLVAENPPLSRPPS